MSCQGTAEEKTAKSDPIYCNRLVNMLVNYILKHRKKIIGLSNYLLSYEKDSTKDTSKSTICFKSLYFVFRVSLMPIRLIFFT